MCVFLATSDSLLGFLEAFFLLMLLWGSLVVRMFNRGGGGDRNIVEK